MTEKGLLFDVFPPLAFTVYCKPEPQGSSKAFIPKGWKRPIITSDNRELKSYRQQVSVVALAEMRKAGLVPIDSKHRVRLTARFYFQRPKSKKKASPMVTRPDLDKLLRAVGDALSKGIYYGDDSQVTSFGDSEELYDEPERTEITIEAIP